MSCGVVENRHPVGAIETRLSGPHRIEQLAVRAPADPAIDEGPCADGAWDVRAQRLPERCEPERLALLLHKYAQARKRAENAVQGGPVDARCIGELRAGVRA